MRVVRSVDNSELKRLRSLPALNVPSRMSDHAKVDRDFSPVLATGTQRVHVSAGGADWEILADGARFYDTRTGKGGGGAVDLVMHLWRVPFKQAVKMLREAGA
jgi:hypothetical protein